MNTESVAAGSKVAIYDLAKELGIAHKDLVEKIRALGIEAKNHMSRLERDEVDRVRRAFEKERNENTVQERVADTVIRRRAKDGSRLHPEAQHGAASIPEARLAVAATPEASEPVRRPVRPSVSVTPSADQPVAETKAGRAVPAGSIPAKTPSAKAEPSAVIQAAESVPRRATGQAETKVAKSEDATKKPVRAKAAETVPAVQTETGRATASVQETSEPAVLAPPAAVKPVEHRTKAPAVETKTAETKASELKAAAEKTGQAKPAEAKPVETKPAEARAAEAQAQAQAQANDTAAVDVKPAKSVETKSVETTAGETKSAGTQASATKAAFGKDSEANPTGTQPAETKPAETKSAETKPVGAKPVAGKETPSLAKAGVSEASPIVVKAAEAVVAAAEPKTESARTSAAPLQKKTEVGSDKALTAAPTASLASATAKPAVNRPVGAQPHGRSATSGPVGANAPAKVFVTAQTRRSLEGLGPTGRVIDLSAFKTASAAKPAPSSESPRNHRVEAKEVAETSTGRGPRQEVSGERLRAPQESRRAPVGPSQPTKGKMPAGRKPGKTLITTAAEHKRVVKMGETIVIAELSRQMAQKATDVLKKIWELGMRNVMINSPIDIDTAQLVASEFEWRVESTAFQEQSVVTEVADKPEDLKPRAPVITIMGHVDHGKTSLLDAIRNANVAAGEAGGITQHIGAYKVTSQAGDVVFLDTPGHEAFTEMRARGAQVTDLVVLVVAADDGIMPQTVEALNHAKDAKVPVIVAVNKIDKQGAQPDRIRQQLAAHGLTPEEWGGQTIFCDVSARTKVGVDKLLEMLALQTEVLELCANPNKAAKGAVIEARMDAKRGPVATVLVQEGTLRVGEIVVVGEEMGKVRAMSDDKGRTLSQAGPSTPVELLGLSGVPRAGEVLNAVADERASKELVEHRRQRRIERDRAKAGPVSLDKLMDAMKAGLKDLKIILKADVQGSVEALASALSKLATKEVKVSIIQSGVGGITESDVNLAKAGNAIIIGFHVRPAGKAAALAEQESVDIKLYDIIYDALDDVKLAMAGLLAPVKRDKLLGKAEVRETFNIPKVGVVAGCAVTEGTIKRAALARLVRDSVLIYSGKLGSLRRFKEDVREVQQGYECGMSIEGYLDIKIGDVIESYEVEEIAPTLA